MRTIRALTIAVAVVVTLPTIAAAQNGRGFADAWFWGVKGGGLIMADSAQNYHQSPMAGIDWMITRTHGGLYVSGAQSFFTSTALTLRDPTVGTDSGFRVIDLKNMRQLEVALMGFPGDHLRFHPYAGVGVTFSDVSAASGRGPFGTTDQITATNAVIQAGRASFSPLLMAGAQYRLTRFSVFGQVLMSPSQKDFILYNGRPLTFGYEFGLRYNVGTSIDRD